MTNLLSHYGLRKKLSLALETVTKTKKPLNGQKLIDILAPNPNVTTKNHQNLIQDLYQTHCEQITQHSSGKKVDSSVHKAPAFIQGPEKGRTPRSVMYAAYLDASIDGCFHDSNPSDKNPIFTYSMKENSISLLFRCHKERCRIGVSLVSNAISLCASRIDFYIGIQVHCLVIVNGFLSNVYVGSSLITFYSKVVGVVDSFRVFDEMPVRNVVSWSAMINGFAKENELDMCLKLYKGMMGLALKVNEFTFTSLLSACMGSGFFGHGKSLHCQIIRRGFESYVHIANSLLSMYCKCGEVNDALYIFGNTKCRDLVSWNSMICGYGQQGRAVQAIELFEEMKKQKVRPDSITFLGVLSSCRHAGLVKEGMFYFDSMMEHGVKPELDHYSCIVDLLGRARLLEEAREFIKKMPVQPNGVIWGSLLMSCRLQGNFWLGIEAAENRLALEPWSTSTHLQLINLYASLGYWDQAARVQKLMKDNRLKRDPGYSWIEISNQIFRFTAEDISMGHIRPIASLMDILVDHMRSFGVQIDSCG